MEGRMLYRREDNGDFFTLLNGNRNDERIHFDEVITGV